MFQTKDNLAEWIQKQDMYISCLQETHFRFRDTESEGMEKTYSIQKE